VTGQTWDHKPEFLKKVLENREAIMTEMRVPYTVRPDPDRSIDIPLLEDNMTVSMGNMHWHFHREKRFTWLQVKLLRFCLGLTVSKNGT
jgi:hypothetical protein